ncbi:hypothetical protein NMY22_g13120 [Coprinellus aureogranulatus]|nr:hypothetical protein NMY22_g13120 [Coprinellus aureogranulatus]
MAVLELLQHPTDAQVEELVQLLTRAFEGQVDVDMQTDCKRSVQEAWHRLGVRAAALEGRIWVISVPSTLGKPLDRQTQGKDGLTIVSTVIAFGPGVMPMGSEAQRKLGLVEYRNSLSRETRQWLSDVFEPANAKMTKESIGTRKGCICPHLDSWLPILVATEPSQQGRGYASMLMSELQRTASSDNTDVVLYASSEDTDSFYEKLGFETKGRATITSRLGVWEERVMLWAHDCAS